MNTPAVIRRKKIAVAAVVLTVIAVVAAFYILRPMGDELLAKYYARQIAQTADRLEAESLIRQAVELGGPGLQVLATGLGSSDEAISRLSREAIVERLEAWQSLRTRYSTPLLARLAHELALAADGFDSNTQQSARKDAARLARRILERRLDRHAANRLQVVGDCQTVMRLAWPASGGRETVAGHSREAIQPHVQQKSYADSQEKSLSIVQLADLPGGGLPKSLEPIPLEETLEDRLQRREAIAAMGNSQTQDTHPKDENNTARWFNVPTVPRPVAEDAEAPGLFRPAKVAERLSHDMSNIKDGAVVEDRTDDSATARRLSGVKTVELLHRLKSADAAALEEVKNELKCRGFQSRHFKLAERVFDPDPAVRMAVARQLPGAARLNSRPWLMLLAADSDSDVRLTAITILATSGGPELLAELETLAQNDPDPRIQLQAKRIADLRDKCPTTDRR